MIVGLLYTVYQSYILVVHSEVTNVVCMPAGECEYEVERKVLQISDSLAVTLPYFWARAHGLKRGDKVRLIFSNHDYLKLVPIPAERK